jgi:hypothetical protein
VIPVLQSESEGVGKSILPTLLGKHVYGAAYSALQAGSLRSERLEFAKECMLLLLDDMQSLAPYQALLNSLATTETLRVDEKYVKSRNVRNTLNMIVTTNYTKPLKVSGETRRIFFPMVTDVKDRPYWKRVVQWFEKEGGGRKLLGVAQLLRGCGGFAEYDPTAPAPRNAKRDEMEEMSISEADKWVHNQLVKSATRDLVLFSEAYDAFAMVMRNGGAAPVDFSYAVFKKAMNTTGKACGDVKRVVPFYTAGKQTNGTVYAVKNIDRWVKQDQIAWRDHVLKAGPAFRGLTGSKKI